VDGQVQVAFNTSATGIASFNGQITPDAYETNGAGVCSNIYCHSDAYDADSAAPWTFTYYDTPAWGSLTSMTCGDCHGIPNHATNELDTHAHQKHSQNYGGIYASRNLAWFDGIGGTHSYPDADEAILQDDGDFFLDPGFLNVAPDILITDGDAALTDFVAGDQIYWNDDGDGNWEVGEDIWWDNDDNGASFDDNEGDHRIYNGGANDAGIGGADTLLSSENDQSIMYLNSDQDDGYYSFIIDVTGNDYDTQYGFNWAYSGSEEPLINVGTAAVATGADLLSTYEVLEPFQGDGTYRSIGYWFDDMQAWYGYDCSECHYNNPPTAGYGTYGTSLHVDATFDVFTSGDPGGVSTYFGTYTPVYLPATKECGVVYCHSDAQFSDGSDGNPDFAGPAGNHVEDDTDTIAPDNTDYHPTYPDWDNSATVTCGSGGTSCHFSGDEDSTMPVAEHPNTACHARTGHVDADQSGWKGNAYDTWCYLCHFDEDGGPYYYYHPYGMPTHVDGSIIVDSAAIPWLNPVTAARGDPCHDAIGSAGWRGPYPGGGC
jgi:predicted CxxxxCH...CXXCH cytochrome family protein